jgi:ketosteroid isomerase-like protein
MAEESAFEIVQKYHRAWTSGDVDAAMEFVAEGIVLPRSRTGL